MLTTDHQLPAHVRIDPARTDLALEFRRKRRGEYSLELQRLLYLMRWSGVGGRFVAFTLEPGRRWMLAELPGRRGVPLVLHRDQVFERLQEAEWRVFCIRWKALTGSSIDDLQGD